MHASAATSAPASSPGGARLESVDLLRGLVMVIMALDHTRDFFHFSAMHGFDPTDLTRTTPAIFFTRWITHYCAPIFSFLAGTGVFLAAQRGKSKRELSWFLVTRGLWLIVLELTFFNWAWSFNFNPQANWGLVIWALGWSMIVLAALIHLPLRAVMAFGLTMIFGHNLLDAVKPESFGAWAGLWNVLHVPGSFKLGSGFSFWVLYPLIPWVGIMAAGYGFGAIFQLPAEVRQRWLWRLGLGAIAAFVVLRWSNGYGDLQPWSRQSTGIMTVASFLNCTKYPPSLCYLLMTLGPGLILLVLLERRTPVVLRPLLAFGRVPMFYYLLHIPLIHGLANAWFLQKYGFADFNVDNPAKMPPDAGGGIVLVYLVWIGVILLLYPACRWFAGVKRRRREAWLSYL